MKKKKNILPIVAIAISLPLLFVGGCATGESYAMTGYNFPQIDKVAIADIFGDIRGDTAKNQISDYFGMELLKKGYPLIERSQVQSVFKEQAFQQEGIWTNPENAAQAGRILNVPAVLVANIDYGEQISMTAKLINVEDGSVLWIGSGSGRTGRGLLTILGVTTGAVGGGAVAGKDKSDKVAGAIVGGVLGGVAGEALTPQQAEIAQKTIKKMCESLPYRLGPPQGTPTKR